MPIFYLLPSLRSSSRLLLSSCLPSFPLTSSLRDLPLSSPSDLWSALLERSSPLRGRSHSSRLTTSRSSLLPRSSPPRGTSERPSCRLDGEGCITMSLAEGLRSAAVRGLRDPLDFFSPPRFLRRRSPSESESEELLSLLLLLLLSVLLEDEESDDDEELLSLSELLLLGLGCWAAHCACLSAMMRGISFRDAEM